MSITNPVAGPHIRAAVAFQSAKGTAASVPAGRIPVLSASRGASLVREDPQGLPPGPGYIDSRVFAAAQVPVVTFEVPAEPVLAAALLESATGGTPTSGGGTTTFVFSAAWPGRWLTMWVDDGQRSVRWTDAAVTLLEVTTDGAREAAIMSVTLAALRHEVIASALGSTGAPTPDQWAHPGHSASVNSAAQSPLRSTFRLEVEHEPWGGFWTVDADDGGIGLPEDLILHRHSVSVSGASPATDQAAARSAAALADSEHAAEWSWTRGTDTLRVVVPIARSAAADLPGLSAGELDDHETVEEARAGTADSDAPATITLES